MLLLVLCKMFQVKQNHSALTAVVQQIKKRLNYSKNVNAEHIFRMNFKKFKNKMNLWQCFNELLKHTDLLPVYI